VSTKERKKERKKDNTVKDVTEQQFMSNPTLVNCFVLSSTAFRRHPHDAGQRRNALVDRKRRKWKAVDQNNNVHYTLLTKIQQLSVRPDETRTTEIFIARCHVFALNTWTRQADGW